MTDRILDAYYEHCLSQVRAGIIDHSLDAALLDGKSVDEHIVDVLRAAGKLPAGWDREAVYVGLITGSAGTTRFTREVLRQPREPQRADRHPEIVGRWLRAS
jgi:hypothetical protein